MSVDYRGELTQLTDDIVQQYQEISLAAGDGRASEVERGATWHRFSELTYRTHTFNRSGALDSYSEICACIPIYVNTHIHICMSIYNIYIYTCTHIYIYSSIYVCMIYIIYTHRRVAETPRDLRLFTLSQFRITRWKRWRFRGRGGRALSSLTVRLGRNIRRKKAGMEGGRRARGRANGRLRGGDDKRLWEELNQTGHENTCLYRCEIFFF